MIKRIKNHNVISLVILKKKYENAMIISYFFPYYFPNKPPKVFFVNPDRMRLI